MQRYGVPIYKRNWQPYSVRSALGRKVRDDVTGFWTYEGYTVKQTGYVRDARRRNSLDLDPKTGAILD